MTRVIRTLKGSVVLTTAKEMLRLENIIKLYTSVRANEAAQLPTTVHFIFYSNMVVFIIYEIWLK